MARGYEGQFGHLLNAPYVWIPLALLFFFGLFDFRRKRKMVHLDLLVLLSFGVSQFFFDRGDIGVSVPLVYPPLVYLLCRMLWIGFKGQRDGLNPSAPAHLARDRDDVPDRLPRRAQHRRLGRDRRRLRRHHRRRPHHPRRPPLRREAPSPKDNPFGDTYGPANYYAYVPFELALPWDGEWDELPVGPRRRDLLRPGDDRRPVLRWAGGCAAPPDDADPTKRPPPGPRAPASASSSPSPGAPTRTRPTRCSRTRTTRWSRR